LAKYETISVKVPSELKEEIKRRGIKSAELFRSAVEAEMVRQDLEELEKRAEKIRPLLKTITRESVVKSIREDRDR